MDDQRSHRTQPPVGGEIGPPLLPTWRSRATSAGWLAALTIGLGAMAALGIAALAVIVWVMVSAAVT